MASSFGGSQARVFRVGILCVACVAGAAVWAAGSLGDGGFAESRGASPTPIAHATNDSGRRRPARASRRAFATPPTPAHREADRPLDVAAVIRRVHFAFRSHDARLVAGDSAFERRVDPTGRVVLVARDSLASDPNGRTASVTLGTRRIVRGSVATPAPSPPRIDDAGRVVLETTSVVERFTNDERGLEQTWHFAAEPAGEGDLVIQIPVGGAHHVVTNTSGVHFAGPRGSLGFRYGHATLVDALGRETALPVRWEHGALALVVPDAALESAVYPLVIDPVIAAEVAVDGAAPGAQMPGTSEPAVAWNGSEYLVVWADARVGGAGPGIYGTRVSAAGAPLDVAGFPITTSATDVMSAPDVASNGPDYLVVWRATSGGQQSLRGARVSAARVVLDGSPLTIRYPSALAVSSPLVVSNGTDYAVGFDGALCRVTAAGSVLEPGGIPVSATPFTGLDAGYAGNYYAVTTQGGYVYLHQFLISENRWNASNQLNGRVFTQYDPTIGCGALDCAIAWVEDTAAGTPDQRVIRARSSVGSAPLDHSAVGAVATPSLGHRGSGYYLTYTANATTTPVLRGATLQSTQTTAYESLSNETPRPGAARLASGGGSVVVLGFPTARFAFASGTGAASLGPYPAAVRASNETDPSVAGNASRYLVAWQDDRIPQGIYAVRLSSAGTVLDTTGLFVGATSGAPSQAPDVATDGTDFAVAFTGASATVRRVSGSTGQLLDAGPIVVGVGGSVDVASSGSRYLVVGDSAGTVYGRRVSSAGAIEDGAPVALGLGTEASVASNGSDFLVAWGAPSGDIRGLRVSAAGAVLDAGGIGISTAANAQTQPTTASNGADYLVAWSDLRLGAADVYGTRLSGAGVVIDAGGFVISSAVAAQTRPAASWNGDEYLVVWEDARGLSADVYGTRVSLAPPLVVVEDAALGSIFAGLATTSESAPSLASGPASSHLLAYVTADSAPPFFGASRVRTRAIAFGAWDGSVCSAGVDCDSGYCVDGVCCATECAGGTADCQACSIAAGADDDGVCGVVDFRAAVACRAPAGPCDAVEYCNGSSAACPPDQPRPSGSVCRAAADPCDVAEVCSGYEETCPADVVEPSGTPCRASRGPCDLAETCDGAAPSCPLDAFEPSGFACRASVGSCDVAEVCDGNGPFCPGNVVLSNGTTCRASVGVCDVAEACSGSEGECPPDGYAGNTTPCDVAHGACDFPDFCTGASTTCPETVVPDGASCDDAKGCTNDDACLAGQCVGALAANGAACRPSVGACDVAETCDGIDEECPANTVLPVDSVCRASIGACDAPEICDGLSPACPGDVRFPSGTPCRNAAGACDLEERCTGASASCPSDVLLPAGALCRGAVTPCDASEYCAGAAACPVDAIVADGTPCDDALTCTQTSRCQLGACQSSLALDCSDGNACTTDACAEPSGCTHVALAACVADAGSDATVTPGTDAGVAPAEAGGCSCDVDGADRRGSGMATIVFCLGLVAMRRARRRHAPAG